MVIDSGTLRRCKPKNIFELDSLDISRTWRAATLPQLGRLAQRHTSVEQQFGHRLWNTSGTVLDSRRRRHKEP